jgi:hypothetical protein
MTYDEMNEIAQRMGLAERVGPIGQSPYDLVPVNPCHVAQATEPKPGWHTLFAPGKQDAIREEMHFISLLRAVPVDIAEQLLKLYRAAQSRTRPSSDIEEMARRVAATNPDLYMPYWAASVNAPASAQTIIPTPQHPFDAAKEAKVKLAKEAEAKKAAEAAKVKQERDEKVGGAIKRAFR